MNLVCILLLQSPGTSLPRSAAIGGKHYIIVHWGAGKTVKPFSCPFVLAFLRGFPYNVKEF